MSGLGTYEGVVLWVSPELCVVEEERRAHHISETTWTTTGELGQASRQPRTLAMRHNVRIAGRVCIQPHFYVCMYGQSGIHSPAHCTHPAHAYKGAAHLADLCTTSTWTTLPPYPRDREISLCASARSTAGAVFGSCQSRSKHGQTPGASYAPNR
jgi:hypothetical protein